MKHQSANDKRKFTERSNQSENDFLQLLRPRSGDNRSNSNTKSIFLLIGVMVRVRSHRRFSFTQSWQQLNSWLVSAGSGDTATDSDRVQTQSEVDFLSPDYIKSTERRKQTWICRFASMASWQHLNLVKIGRDALNGEDRARVTGGEQTRRLGAFQPRVRVDFMNYTLLRSKQSTWRHLKSECWDHSRSSDGGGEGRSAQADKTRHQHVRASLSTTSCCDATSPSLKKQSI